MLSGTKEEEQPNNDPEEDFIEPEDNQVGASDDPLDAFMEDIDKNATKQETYDQFAFNEEQQHTKQSETNDDQSMISFTFGGNQLQDNNNIVKFCNTEDVI